MMNCFCVDGEESENGAALPMANGVTLRHLRASQSAMTDCIVG